MIGINSIDTIQCVQTFVITQHTSKKKCTSIIFEWKSERDVDDYLLYDASPANIWEFVQFIQTFLLTDDINEMKKTSSNFMEIHSSHWLMLFFLVIVSTTIFVYLQATKNCSRFTTCCCSIFHFASFRLTWNCKYSLLSQLHCTYQHNCFKRYFHFLRLSFSTQTAKWTLIEVRAIDIEFIARDNYNNNNINSYNEKKMCTKNSVYGGFRFYMALFFYASDIYLYMQSV